MTTQAARRDFLKATTVTAVGYWVGAGNQRIVRADTNSRLGVVSIGVGGKGGSDCANAARFGDIVGVCDVDYGTLERAQDTYSNAKGYLDYREMLTGLQEKFEVVTISTPDHTHAPAALMAMRMKKHCFVQTPLARTLYEARLMTEVARETGVCTQMGNQGSALDSARMAIAQLKADVLGTLQACYIWCNRPVMPHSGPNRMNTMEKFIANMKGDGANQKDIDEEVKAKNTQIARYLERFDWDLWLGVAPEREFWPGVYHTFTWRSWWDFGTGALGDMGCHQATVPFGGCELRDPISIQARTSGHNFDYFPEESTIHFEFPATANRPAIPFYWYDRRGNRPPKSVFENAGYTGTVADSGILIIGEKGSLYSADDYCNRYELLYRDGTTLPPIEGLEPEYAIAATGGNMDANHMYELFRAIEANDPKICKSNFIDRGGPLTETILLGNLAVWTAAKTREEGEKVEWDAVNLNVTNLDQIQTPGVAELIKPAYRGDYRLD